MINELLTNTFLCHFRTKDIDMHAYVDLWHSEDGDKNQQKNKLLNLFLFYTGKQTRGERLWEFNLSRFSNITYHDYDNNYDYDIIQVMQKTITSLCKVASTITLF